VVALSYTTWNTDDRRRPLPVVVSDERAVDWGRGLAFAAASLGYFDTPHTRA
jgi:hypothetical protein